MSIFDGAELTEHKPTFEEQAATRVLDGDKDGIAWIFHHCMTQADRGQFDKDLVEARHELAFEAGTQEQRFTALVNALIQDFHEMEEAYKNV